MYGIRKKKCNTCSPGGVIRVYGIVPKDIKVLASTDVLGSNTSADLAPLNTI